MLGQCFHALDRQVHMPVHTCAASVARTCCMTMESQLALDRGAAKMSIACGSTFDEDFSVHARAITADILHKEVQPGPARPHHLPHPAKPRYSPACARRANTRTCQFFCDLQGPDWSQCRSELLRCCSSRPRPSHKRRSASTLRAEGRPKDAVGIKHPGAPGQQRVASRKPRISNNRSPQRC